MFQDARYMKGMCWHVHLLSAISCTVFSPGTVVAWHSFGRAACPSCRAVLAISCDAITPGHLGRSCRWEVEGSQSGTFVEWINFTTTLRGVQVLIDHSTDSKLESFSIFTGAAVNIPSC